jgi:dTDP-4-amino-4,6-dideoxygalactose transaminase
VDSARTIPHSRPTLSDEDAARVARVVRGGQLAQGPEVAAFERELARSLGVPAAAAVSSGSAALELALRALGVGPGHEIIIPTYVCDALYHAVVRCGAAPVLADADPETLGLSAADVARRRTSRTRAVIVVHPFGRGIDLADFQRLGIAVVEDCAQTLGATVGGRLVGARGDITVCSFYATKLLTTGEGGAVAGPADLVAHARDSRDYDGRDELVPRFNYKMTDLQAALGRSQLTRLDAFIARRRALAARYRSALARAPRCRVPEDCGDRHVYHRFVVAVDKPLDPVLAHLERLRVAARRPVFRPIHRALGLSGYPNAERLWDECLSIPCYPLLTDAEADRVTAALTEALA